LRVAQIQRDCYLSIEIKQGATCLPEEVKELAQSESALVFSNSNVRGNRNGRSPDLRRYAVRLVLGKQLCGLVNLGGKSFRFLPDQSTRDKKAPILLLRGPVASRFH
jgi:hypothetical protein